jgi:DNA-binding GntR family transcriptional regulator
MRRLQRGVLLIAMDGIHSRAQRASLIRDLLREYLLHGGPRLGQPLAYEYALSRQLGCSRNVLREALALLAADGFVHRERGRGTHVVTTSPAIQIDHGLDLMAALGTEVLPSDNENPKAYRVLLAEVVRAPAVLAALLMQPAGVPVLHVERVVEVGGTRVGHWDLHVLPGPEPLPEVRVRCLAQTRRTEEILRALGLRPDHEQVRVEAIRPSPRTAGLLYQGSHQPTLRLSRRFYDADARMLALAIGRCAMPGATFAVTRQCRIKDLAG